MVLVALCMTHVLYFFGYKTEFFFFSFQNNPKNLDLSHKTDLDFWDCFGITAKFHRTDLVIYFVILERKTRS